MGLILAYPEGEVFFDRPGGVLVAHEGFADEDGTCSGFEGALGVVGVFEAGFGDQNDTIGDFLGELLGGDEVGGHGLEIAVVDADEVGAEIKGAFHLGKIVDFDKDVELDIARGVVEFSKLVVIESGDDEKNGIGTGDTGFVNLALVNGEILAEKRDGRNPGNLHEVGEVALEIFLVREDRHASGSAVDVALCLADGIKVGIDDAGGRRGFFDLGDDSESVRAEIESRAESPKVIAHQGGSAEFFGQGNERFDLLLFVSDDFVQLVHRRRFIQYAKSPKRKAINSTLVLEGGRRNAFHPMKVFLAIAFFLPVLLCAQQESTSSVGSRLTIFGGSAPLRVAMVQDAEILIKDLDRLAGTLSGKPFPIVLQLHPEVQGKPSRIGREFQKLEGADLQYRLRIDLRLGRGNSFHQDGLDRVLLEMLLIERTLRSLPEEGEADRVEVRPWLLDGLAEAMLWKKGKGDRRMYASLVDSGGWLEVEKLVDRKTTGDLDILSRELFRASSGALVMALLSQPQGQISMSNFLGKVAAFEGEPLTLLRTHFPQVNLGAKGLERWWMLQVAAMSEQRLTEAMTVPETETRLVKCFEFHLNDPKGRAFTVGLDSWAEVAALETREERIEALRPASDLLAHLSFRCFPTYRPVIGGYVQILSEIVEGKTENVITVMENLQTFRSAEVQRHTQLVDLLDWYHLSSVKEESGEFDDYLRVQENLRKGENASDDPLLKYIDQVESIFAKPKAR